MNEGGNEGENVGESEKSKTVVLVATQQTECRTEHCTVIPCGFPQGLDALLVITECKTVFS